MKPAELEYCQVVDAMAQRYGKLPSEILESDVSNFRILTTVLAGQPAEG